MKEREIDREIKGRVAAVMRAYGVRGKELKEQLIALCNDEYRERMVGGAESAEIAMQGALDVVKDEVRGHIPKRNPFAFALGTGALFFALALLEMLTSTLFPKSFAFGAFEFYSVAACVAAAAILVYAAATYKLRGPLDFIIPLLIFAGRLATAVQLYGFDHYVAPDGYFTADYLYPGAIALTEYRSDDFGQTYRIADTATAVSLDFYIAAAALIAGTVLYALRANGKLQAKRRGTIAGRVRGALAGYGITSGKLEREMISACSDEYSARLAEGASADEALELATAEVDGMAQRAVKAKNKFAFALKVSAVYAAAAVFEVFVHWFCVGQLYIYGMESALGVLLAAGLLIYCAITRQSHALHDYIFIAVLGLCWLLPCAQIFPYAFIPDYVPNCSAWYSSPFVIEVSWGNNGTDVITLNMLISFMALISSAAMAVISKKAAK